MKGIRPKGKCQKCGGAYKLNNKGFNCPKCLTVPARYQIDFSYNGSRIRRETDLDGRTLETYGQAFALRQQAESEKESRRFDASKWMVKGRKEFRLAELSQKFLSRKKAEVSTLKQYASNFRTHINPALGSMDVREIRRHHIEDLKDGLKLKDPSPVLIALKSFYSWAQKEEIIQAQPSFPAIKARRNRPVVVSREFQLRILSHIPDRHKPIFTWMIFQACRPSEARALKWMDLEGDLVHYRRTWSADRIRETTKKGKDRVNWIFPEAMAALVKRGFPGDFVFSTKPGTAYTKGTLHKWFKRALASVNEELADSGIAPVNITLYKATKHSTGTHLYRQGVDIETLRKHFGHSTMNVTEIYVDVKPADEMRRAVTGIGSGDRKVTGL